jgi:hypothetical protein
MAHKDEPEIPAALESVATRLGELESVLGTHIAPALGAVRAALIGAMAARDRGDATGSVQQIGDAMDRLAALADQLDPGEAALMRTVAQSFRRALLRGDTTQAKQSAAVMFEKSGAVERKKN